MRVVLLFVDGLGIGRKDRDINPCTRSPCGLLANFQGENSGALPFDGYCCGLDVTLGVKGLPQSATGQTALLTGVNAARLLNRHLNGFPNKRLREILLAHSILKKVCEMGKRAAFLNAYRPIFFNLDRETQLRLSATTVANLAAELPFFTLEDVVQGRSLYQDFTNWDLIQRGFEMPIYSPQEAGEILAQESEKYDLCLYEYFKTDAAGHSQEFDRAVEEIQKYEAFLKAFLERVDRERTLIIVSSDHGNVEDLSVKTHTRNPAMTLVWGKGARKLKEKLQSIVDIAPLILTVLKAF